MEKRRFRRLVQQLTSNAITQELEISYLPSIYLLILGWIYVHLSNGAMQVNLVLLLIVQ